MVECIDNPVLLVLLEARECESLYPTVEHSITLRSYLGRNQILTKTTLLNYL